MLKQVTAPTEVRPARQYANQSVSRLASGLSRRVRSHFPASRPYADVNALWLSIASEAARLAGVHAAGASFAHQLFVARAGELSSALLGGGASSRADAVVGKRALVPAGKSQQKARALALADSAIAAGEVGFADQIFTAVRASDPSSKAAVRGLARVLQAQGKPGRAHELLASAGVVAPLAIDRSLSQSGSRSPDEIAQAWRNALGTGRLEDSGARGAGTRSEDALVVAQRRVRAATLFGAPDSGTVANLATDVAGATRTLAPRLMSAAEANAIAPMDSASLAAYVAGKRVCLVANSEAVGRGGLGKTIDAYDVVVRFNSFALDGPHTGERTDIHALIHLHDFNWDVPVDVRWVLSGDRRKWRSSMATFLNPQAQRWVTDDSVRWPLRSGLMIDEEHAAIPTSGFNVMRTLDFLNTPAQIDLIGFDFYESRPYRLQEAMSLPVAAAHNYNDEKTWVMENATEVRGPVISLR